MKLELKKVTKVIKGKKVLDDISVTFETGKIYGIVGRNGSGKTMLFRAMSGLISINDGEIWLNDKLLHKDMDVLPDTSIMLENAGLYPELSGVENLKYLTRLNKKVSEQTIREYIALSGLDPDDRRPYRKYSLGMKHRLVFAQAIFEKPSIYLLDEPTNAVDESGVNQIRLVLKREKRDDAIIIIASHNKEDIYELADKVYRMTDGRLSEESV